MSDEEEAKPYHKGIVPWPKGVSINPGGRPKVLAELRKLIQERGPEIVEEQLQIAAGTATTTIMTQAGPIEVGPSFKDRTMAFTVLMAYGFGKPGEAKEAQGDHGAVPQKRLDLSRLSTEDLQALHKIAIKAKGDENEG